MEIFLILAAVALIGFVIYKANVRKLPVVQEDVTFPAPSAPYEPENVWIAPAVTEAPVVAEVPAVELAHIAEAEGAPIAPVAEAKPKAAPKAKKPVAKKAAAKKTSK